MILEAIWIQKKLGKLKKNPISIEKAAGIVINEWNLDTNEESLKKDTIVLPINNKT